LTNQGRVISRDELIASVWDSRVVSDDAINRCISILRQTLSPQDTHAYIETVRRRGYLAHFPPESGTDPEPGPASRGPGAGRHGYRVLAALSVLAILLAAMWLVRSERIPAEADAIVADRLPVVAVLPFATSGEGDDGPFFANGVHDDLLTQLAQLQSLRVISRTSVLEYRGSEKNLREIGSELGADAILEGNVQSVGDQIRINVQLIDTLTDAHLWAETYDRELAPENLFAVQSEIARAVASAMHATLTAQDTSELAILPTENMAAYRAYHEAMQIRDSLGVSDPAYIAALERAVQLDPNYVRAWVELAGILSFQYFTQPDAGLVERVEQIIDRVGSLSPDSVDYLMAQAYYTYYILRNYEQAYRLISKAHALRPSDIRLLELKSWIERRVGDFDARIESFRQARTLDPRNPMRTVHVVGNLVGTHRYDEASREIEQSGMEIYELEFLAATLALREDADFEKWAAEMIELQRAYGSEADPSHVWDALVANRDFVAADALARDLPEDFESSDVASINGLADKARLQLLSGWFLGQGDRNDELLARLLTDLEASRQADGGFPRLNDYLAWSLLMVVDGQFEEAKRAVRRWQREAVADLAELWAKHHLACRLLGMAGAAAAATDCIRNALSEPSFVMPFVEPYLPYYDAIRDEPEFVDLLSELDP
jgi:TolB-like protein